MTKQANTKNARTDSDWWPSHLAHVPKENPWDHNHVIVAEIKSFDDKPHHGRRMTYSALVPIDRLDDFNKNQVSFDLNFQSSGPHPCPSTASSYEPKFWIEATSELGNEKFEPLVLRWSSHDKTVLMPDPGFLMTYGLAERSHGGSHVVWDDPSGPVCDVVKVLSPSIWEFPKATSASVAISKNYLQDYLTLRNMALVQVYYEQRWSNTDDEIEQQLNDDEQKDIQYLDREVRLMRSIDDHQIIMAEVLGHRVIAFPGELPITENSLEKVGIIWPGFSEPITDSDAMKMNTSDVVYVDDSVLEAYEGRDSFNINPKSGSVSFGTQWRVGYCDRVGRNLIRLELKKLYEGVPPNVTHYWNKYSVEPVPDSAYPEILDERNIGVLAEDITLSILALGDSLVELAKYIGINDTSPEDYVRLRRKAIDYSGWWTFDEIKEISWHIPLDLSMNKFIDRCMSLDQLAIEGLSEAKLRNILSTVGVPRDIIKDYRGLKLLNCIIRMAQVSKATGLSLADQGSTVWERLESEGIDANQPITYLFALNDIRQLKAHSASNKGEELRQELERFGINSGEELSGYGKVLDKVYDALSSRLYEVSKEISDAVNA